MNKTTLSWILITGTLASLASGAIRYRASGPWESLENLTTDPPEPGWQSPTAPGTADTVRANWGGQFGNVVTLDYETTVGQFQIGVDEGGKFHILEGGILRTAGGNNKVGNNTPNNAANENYNSPITGALEIDAGGEVHSTGWLMIAGNSGELTGVVDVSGLLTSQSHLWMATGGQKAGAGAPSNAILNIHDGGVVRVNGNIGLGTVNAKDPSGGIATVNINNGGTLDLHQWRYSADDDGSIQPGSVININAGGTLAVEGNRVGQANTWIAEGKIATDAEELIVTYDTLDAKTFITTPRPPLTAEITASTSEVTISWDGDPDSLYNIWSTSDLSVALAEWDPAATAVDGSEATLPLVDPALFYVLEEYPKPPALLNGDFDDPGGLPAGGLGEVGDPWVVDDTIGLTSSWNPEDPDDFEGKPSGPFMVLMESDVTGDGTAFGISQVLAEFYADDTNYTVSVKAGNPKVYDWPGYRVELWADGTLIASVDDTTGAGVPADGKFVTVTLDYVAGTVGGLTPGAELEVKLLSRNVDVDNVLDPALDWGVCFDDVRFRSTKN